MMRMSSLVLTVVSSLLTFAAPAQAEDICEQRDAIVIKLKEMYHESHVASGLESGSKMVEIWTGKSGSWTILVTRASGISCVVASGNNWMNLNPDENVVGTAS